MLKIKDLKVSIEEKQILKGLNLDVKPGEIHAIMGLNGSGKSTLANVLAGKEGYEIDSGTVEFLGQDLLDLDPEKRAALGIFLAFQYPVELPGVVGSYFLRTAYNAIQKENDKAELGLRDFSKLLKEKLSLLEFDESYLARSVNEGFSGGEKKRNEVFQLSVLNPQLAILDETDSGLDIDALKIVSEGVNKIKAEDPNKSFVIITHYQRLLNYIKPDVVHVMIDGQIVKSGDFSLAKELEAKGYDGFKASSAA